MAESNEPQASEEPQQAIKTILVVEDDADIGFFLVEAIKQETPYQALLATTGSQALTMVQSLKPDLFILDYVLPLMNGIELYDTLAATEKLKDIPVIFMSANIPTDELSKRRVYFIRKPFELEEMLETVKKLLAEGK